MELFGRVRADSRGCGFLTGVTRWRAGLRSMRAPTALARVCRFSRRQHLNHWIVHAHGQMHSPLFSGQMGSSVRSDRASIRPYAQASSACWQLRRSTSELMRLQTASMRGMVYSLGWSAFGVCALSPRRTSDSQVASASSAKSNSLRSSAAIIPSSTSASKLTMRVQ